LAAGAIGESTENGEKWEWHNNTKYFFQWKLFVLIDSDLLGVFLLLRFDKLNLEKREKKLVF